MKNEKEEININKEKRKSKQENEVKRHQSKQENEVKRHQSKQENEVKRHQSKQEIEAKKHLRKREAREKREHRSRSMHMSLRFFVIFSILLLCAGILVSYCVISGRVNRKNLMSQLMDDMQYEIGILQDQLVLNNYSVTEPQDLNLIIDNTASHFYGRVMVVNRKYTIIKDTFVEDQNSKIISEEVIRVMNGGDDSFTEKNNFLQYIHGIKVEDDVKGVIIINASLGNINKISDGLSERNILICFVIFLVCCWFAVLIANASVRGIKMINKQMEITKDGHLDEKIPVRGFKEFRSLTSSYNDTIDKLMVLDSTRQEFVSNVSHELKTPITSMKVLADSLLQNEEADLAMYKEFMTDIVEEVDRESKIITDLLTLVKMDKKSDSMNINEVDINELLEIIFKRVNPIAENRNIEIIYEKYRDVVAEVDEVKLSLALTNLIENAVKYNVDNGWVKVTLNSDHKNFHIKVADSGVGIPDDCKDQVFERFYRVDKARSRDTGGTGLGLAITKNVILMHKGNIKLYSEYGEGTTFTVKIPLKYSEV